MLTNPLGVGDAKCGLCGLYKTCRSPKMEPTGKGKRKILIIAEAPGAEEDREGMQLVGNSGQKVIQTLARCGIDMRRDCTLTNALICRPPNNVIKDKDAISYCRPNLIKTVRAVNAEVVVPLGGKALESLLGWLWGDKQIGAVARWAGYRIPSQELNAWICPTWHPSFLLHEKEAVPELQFYEHLKAMSALSGRPWNKVPDYESKVEPIFSVREAAVRLRDIKPGDTVAFDYETNCLKPEPAAAKIYSCSVCVNGKWTIAFPWDGEVIEQMRKLLRDPRVIKIACNAKFEDRWTRKKLGIEIRGWLWDTMLSAHALENATKIRTISSIKFQAFVHLGQRDWSAAVDPYLKAKGGNTINRIRQIGIRELLIYNGMDSLIEWKIAHLQQERMGYD